MGGRDHRAGRRGRTLWNRRESAEPVGDNRFDNSSVRLPGVLLLDTQATRLRALDPRTGQQRWERTGLDGFCTASAEYLRTGDLLVVTSLCPRSEVPALRLDTGADAWTATVGDPGTRTAGRPALFSGGVVGIWGHRGELPVLVGVDAATGEVLWRRQSRVAAGPATVTGGRFVLAELGPGDRPRAVALDPRTGRAVPPRLGLDRRVVLIGDGPGFTPA